MMVSEQRQSFRMTNDLLSYEAHQSNSGFFYVYVRRHVDICIAFDVADALLTIFL